MRKFWGITWRAVGVSPPSYPHLTRRAYAAPLAGFAATGNVTPLIVTPAVMLSNLCMGAYTVQTEGRSKATFFLSLLALACRLSI